MFLITITIVVSSPCLKYHFGGMTQGGAQTETAALTETVEAAADNALKDFKPPKHSFINYEAFFGNNILVLAYHPLIANLIFYDAFQLPPEVYPDIFVPPQNIA